ncbi:MAG TPA: hypothetical protein VE010_09900, partial [Thermoanaerobaculia bacterium]|nr:hypothetical protein [Thermoanaerobaculia bacterium]
AREVQFTPAVEGNWEIRDVADETKTIVLRRNATIRIENDSKTHGQHQKHYSDVLAGNTAVRDLKLADLLCGTADCTMNGIRQPTFGANIQCSNNQWP